MEYFVDRKSIVKISWLSAKAFFNYLTALCHCRHPNIAFGVLDLCPALCKQLFKFTQHSFYMDLLNFIETFLENGISKDTSI